jgi:hypothetical protein
MILEEPGIDIKTRRKLWLALSEFYLDTQLMKEDFERIASVFRHSGLKIQAIKKIDKYEVFPILQPNLSSIAGEWLGFDEDWLFENCEKQIGKQNNWLYKAKINLWNSPLFRMRKDYWISIENILNKNTAQQQ